MLGAALSLANVEAELVGTRLPSDRECWRLGAWIRESVLNGELDTEVLWACLQAIGENEASSDRALSSHNRAMNCNTELANASVFGDVERQHAFQGHTFSSWCQIFPGHLWRVECHGQEVNVSIIWPSFASMDDLAEVDWIQVCVIESLDECLDSHGAAHQIASRLSTFSLEVAAKFSTTANHTSVEDCVDQSVQALSAQLDTWAA